MCWKLADNYHFLACDAITSDNAVSFVLFHTMLINAIKCGIPIQDKKKQAKLLVKYIGLFFGKIL